MKTSATIESIVGPEVFVFNFPGPANAPKNAAKPVVKKKHSHSKKKPVQSKGRKNVLSRYTAFAKGIHPMSGKSVIEDRIAALPDHTNEKRPASTKKTRTGKKPVVDPNNFNILVVEKEDSNFAWELNNIVGDCKAELHDKQINLIRLTDIRNFNFARIKRIDLVFIEDQFLIENTPLDNTGLQSKHNIILLLNMHFVSRKATEIKQAVEENSLNLSGHIFLTDYSQSLVKKWITDLIKNKEAE